MEFIDENYCTKCDEVVHTHYHDGNLRPTRCPKCGAVVMPCNSCEDTGMCGECPYRNMEVAEPMTDEEYILWLKENEPAGFMSFKNHENGDFYYNLIQKMGI